MGVGVLAGFVLTGCGGTGESEKPAAAPIASADQAAIFQKFEASSRPRECSTAWDDFFDAATGSDRENLLKRADDLRGLVMDWNAALRLLEFPAQVTGEVDELIALNAAEAQHLSDIGDVEVSVDTRSALTRVLVDDAKVYLATNALRGGLGHPSSQVDVAMDELDLARTTAVHGNSGTVGLAGALDRRDLAATKTIFLTQGRIYGVFGDSVNAISFPSAVSDEVDELKSQLAGLLATSRAQADAKSIDDVAAKVDSEKFTPTTVDKAADSLYDALMDIDKKEDPGAYTDGVCS